MTDTFPILYILVRTDLDSLNPGKLGAQTSHCGSAFAKHMKNDKTPLYKKWLGETNQGFGTVLVLAVNDHQMRFTVEAAKRYGLIADIVLDPSYPIRVDRELGEYLRGTYPDGLVVGDGDRYVTIMQDTCAYIFMDKNDPIAGMLLGGYKLHP